MQDLDMAEPSAGDKSDDQTGSEKKALTKKGHPPLPKSTKLIMSIATGVFVIVMGSLLIQTLWIGSSADEVTVSPKTISSIDEDETDELSKTHIDAVEVSTVNDAKTAGQTGETLVENGIFDFEPSVSDSSNVEAVVQQMPIGGVSAKEQPLYVRSSTPDQDDIDTKDNDNAVSFVNSNDGGKPSVQRHTNSPGGGANSLEESRKRKIQKMIKTYSGITTTGKSQRKTGSRFTTSETKANPSNTAPSPRTTGLNLDMNFDSNRVAATSSNGENQEVTEGKGRGLRVGDLLLGKVKNGQNSDSPSQYMIVEILQAPLKGATIAFKPEVKYDNYVFSGTKVNYGANKGAMTTIIVTPDENLSSGYRSSVDYHTLYRWGMIFFSGVTKGGAEYINSLGGDVTVDGSTVVQSKKLDPFELIVSSLGGVADAANSTISDAINRPPTVEVHTNDLVGVLIVSDFNPPWIPFINKNQTSLQNGL